MGQSKIVAKAYNLIAEEFDKRYCQKIYFKEQLDYFLSYLKPGSLILDAGCGSGHVDSYLVKKGHKVVGIDISEEMIKLAKKRVIGEFFVMDIRDIKFKSKFDAVLSLFSLFHVDDKEFINSIKIFSKNLKKGGFLFLGLPEGDKEGLFYEDTLNPKVVNYFNYYQKDFVYRILKQYGFNIINCEDRFLKGENHNEFFITARFIA